MIKRFTTICLTTLLLATTPIFAQEPIDFNNSTTQETQTSQLQTVTCTVDANSDLHFYYNSQLLSIDHFKLGESIFVLRNDFIRELGLPDLYTNQGSYVNLNIILKDLNLKIIETKSNNTYIIYKQS